MMNVEFKLVWFPDLKEWRVIGTGGHYAGCKSAHGIPDAMATMLKSEGDILLRMASLIEHAEG